MPSYLEVCFGSSHIVGVLSQALRAIDSRGFNLLTDPSRVFQASGTALVLHG